MKMRDDIQCRTTNMIFERAVGWELTWSLKCHQYDPALTVALPVITIKGAIIIFLYVTSHSSSFSKI